MMMMMMRMMISGTYFLWIVYGNYMGLYGYIFGQAHILYQQPDRPQREQTDIWKTQQKSMYHLRIVSCKVVPPQL